MKNFIKRGTTASRKERRHILREVNSLWKAEATGEWKISLDKPGQYSATCSRLGITDGPLQAIVFHIGLCLPRYLGDAVSTHELMNFIRLILDLNSTSSSVYIIEILERTMGMISLDAPS